MSAMLPLFIAAARERNPQSNEHPVPSTERRLVYIIDAPATWQSVGIVAEIATEHRRLDGSWELPTSLPASAFELRGAAIEATLRHACDAERCRLRTAADERPTKSLRWDDGPPWQLRVHVAREEPEHYVITAGLHRGGVEMPITEPALVHWEGWVIARGTIARFDFNGAFAIAALFRNAGHIAASREELSDFLTSFNALPRVPPIDLPHGVPVTEVHAAPIPTLKVLPPVPSARRVRRLATGFRYGPLEITGAERTPTVYDADTRTVHYRDFAAEAAARARLASHRVKQEWGEDAELGEHSLVIPAHKLGTLVADVVRAGWQVDAGGAEYRSPGPTRAIVRSGIDWFELDAGVQFGEVEVSLSELLEARRAGATSILLPDGAFGLLPLEWLARLGPLTAGGRSVGGVIRYRPSQVALLDALLGAVPEASVDATFEKARAELRTFEKVSAVDAGPDFGGTLRAYQREGLGWLDFLHRFGLGGCLADDMGLGKTVQVLALLDAVLDGANRRTRRGVRRSSSCHDRSSSTGSARRSVSRHDSECSTSRAARAASARSIPRRSTSSSRRTERCVATPPRSRRFGSTTRSSTRPRRSRIPTPERPRRRGSSPRIIASR